MVTPGNTHQLLWWLVVGLAATVDRASCSWLHFYNLTVTNNAPVVWGSHVTFEGILIHSLDFEYIWTWDDGLGHPVEMRSKQRCTFKKAYSEPSNYTMTVEVKYFLMHLTTATSKFRVSETIPGKIELFASNETTPITRDRYLPTGTEVDILTQLYDPDNLLYNSTSIYWLHVDKVVMTSPGPNITYNFTIAGDFKVRVLVNMYSQSGEMRWAMYYATVKVREPIHHINITGNTLLQRGEMVKLVADCDGSSPWVYCWKPFDDDNTTAKDISCSNVMTTNKCNFRMQYYFQRTGHHLILVNITNDVKRFTRIVPVTIFKVLPEPDLSIIVMPVVFGLLAITIILVGLLYYVQVRRRFTIEVADFDFTSSDSVVYQTFFEQLKDAIMNSLPRSNNLLERGWNFLDCRTEADTISNYSNSSNGSEIKASEGTVEVAADLPLP